MKKEVEIEEDNLIQQIEDLIIDNKNLYGNDKIGLLIYLENKAYIAYTKKDNTSIENLLKFYKNKELFYYNAKALSELMNDELYFKTYSKEIRTAVETFIYYARPFISKDDPLREENIGLLNDLLCVSSNNNFDEKTINNARLKLLKREIKEYKFIGFIHNFSNIYEEELIFDTISYMFNYFDIEGYDCQTFNNNSIGNFIRVTKLSNEYDSNKIYNPNNKIRKRY